MLLYVLESHGSSPGRQGFLMAVTETGELAGSIGGGIMEHKFVEMAKEQLRQPLDFAPAPGYSVRRQYHDKSAARNQSGMICSGDQTILLYPVQPDDRTTVQGVISCLEQNEHGQLTLSPAGIQFGDNNVPSPDYQFSMTSADDWLYQEKMGYKHQLFIVGGGHCALALSQLMNQLDFYIRIYEDRPDLHTWTQNQAAHEKIRVESYDELTQLIPSGHNHYVVVMTVGYRTDEQALQALLPNAFRYLGLLGSPAKISKLFAALRDEGADEEALQRIHAPIGLAINSQTPEEIAISIAAEIIRVKNGG